MDKCKQTVTQTLLFRHIMWGFKVELLHVCTFPKYLLTRKCIKIRFCRKAVWGVSLSEEGQCRLFKTCIWIVKIIDILNDKSNTASLLNIQTVHNFVKRKLNIIHKSTSKDNSHIYFGEEPVGLFLNEYFPKMAVCSLLFSLENTLPIFLA